MLRPGSPEAPGPEVLPELTDEQIAAGKEIAGDCGFDDVMLGQHMRWRGQDATVRYGLGHSAHRMEDLTVDEIIGAVAKGIADYQQLQNSPAGPN